MSEFRFELTDGEKQYLKDLVVRAISSGLGMGGDNRPPEPPTDRLREQLGAFVTLKLDGSLRGCIGNVQGTGPLYRTVWDMALSAAFRDPRFEPLGEDEFKRIEYEISILGPIEPCPGPELVQIGRHGLIMSAHGRSGLLLPQVPVEWNWDRETFLGQTCYKAGLPRDAWKDPDTNIFWFEAEVF